MHCACVTSHTHTHTYLYYMLQKLYRRKRMCRVAHGNMWSATYYVIVTHRNERTNTPGCANLFRDIFFGVRVRQHYDVNCAGVCGGGGGGYAVCRLPLVMWRHVRVYTRYAKFSVRFPCRMPIRLRQTLAVVPCHPASSTAICRYGWGCVCVCARAAAGGYTYAYHAYREPSRSSIWCVCLCASSHLSSKLHPIHLRKYYTLFQSL